MVSGPVEQPPEAPLWAFLDRHDLPFRNSMGQLLDAHGAVEGPLGTDRLDGTLPGRPLLPGASEYSFSLLRRWGGDPSLPPAPICSRYRGADPVRALDGAAGLAEANLAAVIAALAPQLGPGCDTSTETSHAWRWDFGAGSIEARSIPSLQHPLLAGKPPYIDDPDALVQCVMSIFSAWEPPLTAEERGHLAGFTPLVPLGPVKPGGFDRQQPWRRWTPDLGPRLPDGCGPSLDGKAFVAVSGDRFCILPRNTLKGLRRWAEYPAKGPGRVTVQIMHNPPEKMPGYWEYALRLGEWPYEPDTYASEARILAGALNLRLDDTSVADD